jgi:hypothetical protein
MCEDIYVEPQVPLKQHAGQNQHIKQDTAACGGHNVETEGTSGTVSRVITDVTRRTFKVLV